MSSLWRAAGLRDLTCLSVLAFSSFFLTLSSLPLYAVAIGASAGAAGLVTTVMLASTVGTQVLVPAVVGRQGLVKVLAAGLVLLGAPGVLYLVDRQFWWVLGISVLRGFGFAIITVLLPLVASRMVPTERRGEAIGLYGLAIAIPNLVAVPLGVALTAAGHFGWVAVLTLAPLAALPLLRRLTAAMVAQPAAVVGAPVPRKNSRSALRAVAGTVLVLLTVTLAGGGVLTFLPVVRPDGLVATVALLAFGAAGALARWRVGGLSDRFGNRRLLPLAVLVAAGGMVLVAGGLGLGTSALVIAGAAVLGTGYGSVQNISLLVAFDLAGPANQTTASAAWNAAFDAGTGIGALAVGLIATSGFAGGPGFPWTFAGCGVFILCALPLAVRAGRSASLGEAAHRPGT